MSHTSLKASKINLLAMLPGPVTEQWPQGEPYAKAVQHGAMSVALFAPSKVESQIVRPQDEVYLISTGLGQLVIDGKVNDFGPGDVFIVPAGIPHIFKKYTVDFTAWTVSHHPKSRSFAS